MGIDADDLEALPGGSRDREAPLELDDIFAILKNQRRRRALRYLAATPDGRATLSDLAEHVAGLENDVEPAALSSKQRKRTYVALYQAHLPKLDEYGVIAFDADRGTVDLRDTGQLDPYLEQATASELAADGSGEPADAPGKPADGDEAREGGATTGTLPAGLGARMDGIVAWTTAALVLGGLAGVGPLAAVGAGVWTLVSLAALLWVAAG